MLVVGVHPVLAMHFCAGDLYSVSLANDNQQDHSCCEGMKDMPKDDCANEAQSHDILPSSFTGMDKNCCDFEQVELSTDDFNHQVQQFNLNNILPSFDNVWLVLHSIFNHIEPDNSAIVQHIFPPGGLNRLNTDLLTYICIYRI